MIRAARANGTDLEYLAYKQHQDTNASLWKESIGEFSVWGMTILVDIQNPTRLVLLQGWKFRVKELASGKILYAIPMQDNSALKQPQGMQLDWQHDVLGVHSEFLHFSITFRSIREDKITAERQKFKDQITSKPFCLGKYLEDATFAYHGPFSTFQLPGRTQNINPDSATQLETLQTKYEWAKQIQQGYRFCRNPSCNAVFVDGTANEHCQCSTPRYYGPIPLPIGTQMTKADMVEQYFISSTACSFAGNKKDGIAALYIGLEHADNDLSLVIDPDRPTVIVAGIGGRLCVDGEWVQVYNQPAARNMAFWTNEQFGIPTRLAVPTYWHKDCVVYTYLGLWLVIGLLYKKNTDRQNDTFGKSVVRIELVPLDVAAYRLSFAAFL